VDAINAIAAAFPGEEWGIATAAARALLAVNLGAPAAA
jgi:hypothetical protein